MVSHIFNRRQLPIAALSTCVFAFPALTRLQPGTNGPADKNVDDTDNSERPKTAGALSPVARDMRPRSSAARKFAVMVVFTCRTIRRTGFAR